MDFKCQQWLSQQGLGGKGEQLATTHLNSYPKWSGCLLYLAPSWEFSPQCKSCSKPAGLATSLWISGHDCLRPVLYLYEEVCREGTASKPELYDFKYPLSSNVTKEQLECQTLRLTNVAKFGHKVSVQHKFCFCFSFVCFFDFRLAAVKFLFRMIYFVEKLLQLFYWQTIFIS